MSDKDILIDFAEKIGELNGTVKSLKSNFKSHKDQHKLDRIMQWIILFLQTIIIAFLGWLKLSGKI